MVHWDEHFFGTPGPAQSREQVEALWIDYLKAQVAGGRPWSQAMRHALGLWNGQAGSRRWRQVWSDHKLKALSPDAVAQIATQARTEIVQHLAAAAVV
jgi:tRNA-dihydrouridine synthase A